MLNVKSNSNELWFFLYIYKSAYILCYNVFGGHVYDTFE